MNTRSLLAYASLLAALSCGSALAAIAPESILQAATPGEPNYGGLWYNAPAESEAGWGINFAHQGDVIFATWFTYDTSGKPWWLTMTANKIADGVYGGMLYTANGAPFSAYVPPAMLTLVGTGTVTFTSATTATFGYTVNGVAQAKSIVLQTFGPVPICVWGAQADQPRRPTTRPWWATAGAESGWG